jgi:hypothetical protein
VCRKLLTDCEWGASFVTRQIPTAEHRPGWNQSEGKWFVSRRCMGSSIGTTALVLQTLCVYAVGDSSAVATAGSLVAGRDRMDSPNVLLGFRPTWSKARGRLIGGSTNGVETGRRENVALVCAQWLFRHG